MFHSRNPATGHLLFSHQESSKEDIDKAVCTALSIQKQWAKNTLEYRIKILKTFQKNVKKQASPLAKLISLETGKPLWESHTEVQACIQKIDISILAFKTRCQNQQIKKKDLCYETYYKPIGILAVIGPFNFPVHLAHGHIIPALLAGNAICFKPSEYTTQTALFCQKLW